MKTKASKKTAPKRRNEFRYHDVRFVDGKGKKKNIKHPSYIWQERGNLYDYHQITHSKEIKGVRLRELRSNPNPNDKRKSYYVIASESDVKSNFGRKRKGWKLNELDRKEIHGK